ncbi:DUF47 family protein [Anaeromyxobacter oryzae]|uniref:DUF47 family protein n=1 Tax=Anaeromyxobacter oryzae TaxID=2918170 RepID=UPI0020BF41B2|nr:DUF47 family protein [Anaeromyxobacter oryzae]
MKGDRQMLATLGASELLLPALVNRALAANDRAKYLFTLLQAAARHGDDPDEPPVDLRRERLRSGVGDADLDDVPARTRRCADGTYELARADRIHAALGDAVGEMVAAVEAAPGPPERWGERSSRLLAAAVPVDAAHVSAEYVHRLTSGDRAAGDSLHLLVMDLHRRLHEIQVALASTSVDGASAYGLSEDATELVRAFMHGVHRTAALKLDHPGLGTTATQVGARVVVENDLGTTDAHLLLVRVEGLEARVVATDVHLERLGFLRSLLAPFDLRWDTIVTRRNDRIEEGAYHLATGEYTAKDRADLAGYLEHLGSRLVFLIDWNRARKRLRLFVKAKDAVDLLRWAAERELGHMPFLALGGERLVFDALERLPRIAIRYGEQLHEVLGRDRAIAFLRFVLERCSTGIREGRSEFLIRDEIRAELMSQLATAEQSLLAAAAEHASLVVELAASVRDALQRFPGDGREELERAAARAAGWERRADGLVERARVAARRWEGSDAIERILVEADDIADHLEDVTFLLTILATAPPSADDVRPLAELAELTLAAARQHLMAFEGARALRRSGAREDLHDVLEAVDQVVLLERRSDDANRRAKRRILTTVSDFHHAEILSDIRRHLEAASDALKHVALALRSVVMGEVGTA